MTSRLEKGDGTFQGIKMFLCENPLPPLEEAVAAAQVELPASSYYTEPYSAPLRHFLAESLGVLQRLLHINAGSELILRQIFDRLGQQVQLRTQLNAAEFTIPVPTCGLPIHFSNSNKTWIRCQNRFPEIRPPAPALHRPSLRQFH